MAATRKTRTGRRPGDSGTREAILGAARARFAREGFQAATVRAMATDAGVDPALVLHYFGSKESLFVAAMEFPLDPAEVVPRLVGPGVQGLGYRVIRFMLGVIEQLGADNPMLALIRSATGHPAAARMFREFLSEAVLDRVAAAVAAETGADRPRLRAELCASQIVGVLVARQILELPELAATDVDTLAAAYGPTLQRYLTGSLDSA